MGAKIEDDHCPTLWLLNLDKDGNVLKEAARGLVRLSWRIIYRHMTQLQVDKIPFSAVRVNKDISTDFTSRLLAFQRIRRKFLLTRRYSILTYMLPGKCIKRVGEIGTLSPLGAVSIKTELKAVLSEASTFREFI